MNCRPGDIAVVVSGRNLGLIVEIVCVSQTYGSPHWCVKTSRSAIGTNPDHTLSLTKVGSIHDARLRPIMPDAPDRAAQVQREVEATT